MHRRYKLTLPASRPVLSVVAGLFVIAIGVLASGAAVRHALHQHANTHSGPCAICSFAKGQVETTVAPLTVYRPVTACVAAAVRVVSFLPQNSSFLLPPGRAPPVRFVVS